MIPAETEPGLPRSTQKFTVPVIWLLVALAVVFVWRYFLSGAANLIPDECSYWSWSRRLDWSYFDNSGMVAYLIRLSTWLFGESTPFSVRFPFLVLSGFTTYLIYRVSFLLFGNRLAGLIAATLFNLTPLALLGGSAAVHDTALVFFWMVALWTGALFLKSGDGRWFYAMGLAAGLCIQSKYTGVLVPLCLLIFLLWSKEHRQRLLTREPWIGALIALLFAVPILVWNAAHDWASFHHILFIGSGAQSVTKRLSDGLGYHVAQLALVSPLFYFALVVGVVAAILGNLRARKPEEVLLLSFGFPLLLFGVFAFKGHVSELGLHGIPLHRHTGRSGDSVQIGRWRRTAPREVVRVAICQMGDDSGSGTGRSRRRARVVWPSSSVLGKEMGQGGSRYLGDARLEGACRACGKNQEGG